MGNGTGSFGTATNFAVGSWSVNLTSDDFNGDGKPDIAVANSSSNNISFLLNCSSLITEIETDFHSKEELCVGIFPNPSSDKFTVNLRNTTVVTQICVYDVFGNCLWSKKCQNETSYNVDLSVQSKGVYFFKIMSDNKRSVHKVVLQ